MAFTIDLVQAKMNDENVPLRALKTLTSKIVREAVLLPRCASSRSSKHRVVFLPSRHREAASLLRSYELADGLVARGWGAMCIPPHLSLSQRKRIIRLVRPDVVVIQKCRHPLNRARYYPDQRLVLDPDDADFLDPLLEGAMAEAARRSVGVICGSRFIEQWARRYNESTSIVWTGSRPSAGEAKRHTARAPIVAWAQSTPLAYQREMEFVRSVLSDAWMSGCRFTFRIYGWPKGYIGDELQPLQRIGVPIEFVEHMPYEDFLLSLRDVAIGLSAIIPESEFSRGKSFGKILGYLDARVPVICSDEADHSLFFRPETGVVSSDPHIWVSSIAALLSDPEKRQAMADAAYQEFISKLSLDAAVDRTDAFLKRLLAEGER